jgi:hypothetical protein
VFFPLSTKFTISKVYIAFFLQLEKNLMLACCSRYSRIADEQNTLALKKALVKDTYYNLIPSRK